MTDQQKTQDAVDRENAAFWDELCGSQLAKQLGITDRSMESLKKFDDFYFGYYPYLFRHIPFSEFKGKKVLEVGLGYGTVAQKIAESGAHYHGLDIAAGPVGMAHHRCRQVGAMDADVRQGSILAPPFADQCFDYVVAIGCLHHTGNLAQAIRVLHRLLRPGAIGIFMVYNAASYRQFATAPFPTLCRWLGLENASQGTDGDERMRGAYDSGSDGSAAPQTEFVTKTELRSLCRDFSRVSITLENIGAERFLARIPRDKACRWLGPFLGLDLYCRVVK